MPVAHTSLSGWRVSNDESLHSDFRNKLNGSFHTFLAFCQTMWPYLLPPLLAIALESPLSQRTWIAVQNTPAPPRRTSTGTSSPPSPVTHLERLRKHTLTHLQELRKHTLTHLAPVYLIFVSLLASYLHCVAHVPPEKIRIIEGVMFGPLFVFATTRLFGLLLRIYSLSVQRDADGDPYVIRTLHPSVPRICAAVPLLLGLIITHCFLRHEDDNICKVLVHTALLHVFIATDVRSTKSMRAVGVYALTNIVTLLALSVFLAIHAQEIRFLINTTTEADHRSVFPGPVPSPGTGPGPGYEIGEATAYRWPLFALCVLWNIFPVELVTLCYRFDFWRAYKRSGGYRVTRFEDGAVVRFNLDYGREGEGEKEKEKEKEDGGNGFGNDFNCADADADARGRGQGQGQGQGQGPSLTHDLLLDAETLGVGKTRGMGPIHLSQNTPDAFYSHPSRTYNTYPDPSPGIESPPLLIDARTPIKTPGSEQNSGPPAPATPLPSTLRTLLPIPFPAFLSSLTAYTTMTVLLSSLLFFATQNAHRELLTSYLLPLLPLVTLPLIATAVPLGVALYDRAGVEDGINDLWHYEESWGSRPGSDSGGSDAA